MATFLAVPLKRTWEVDLQKPLKTFITSTFDKIDPEDYNKALQEFHKLRNNVIAKSVDRHESSLEILHRYYDQLVAIEGKLPIAENQIRINFKWQDAFDKESFFSGRRVLAIASGSFERVCVLFNIAALQSQIGANQSAESDEGLKTAAKHFQASCGIFRHLKDIVLSHVQNEPTPDMQPDTLGALASLMLAQAQDCICRKAITGKMKSAIVVKLCHQASDLYADAMKILQLQSIRDLWPRDWISSVAGKQAAYHALAEYFQALVSKENKEFGEEIARLRHAKDLMSAAETRGGQAFIFQKWSSRIQRALDEANKDNDLIYHARVPDLSTLPALGKHAVAKATDFAEPLSSNFQDLFEKVVPLAVHSALQMFEGRKGEIVNVEIGRLREATQLLNSILASLNLPASIEDLSGKQVPASVLEKAAKTREMGGISYLGQLMTELPALLTRNREILDEAVRMLDEEENSDKQLRQQFGERWSRTSSDKLTAPIRAEANKYRAIIDNAIQADKVVQDRFGSSREGIDILSKSDGEIETSLPSGSPVAALQGSPVVAELRKLMETVDTIKAERDVIEAEIKNAKCDMSSKFMTALAQDGAIDEQSLTVSELDTIYSPLREQVSDSIHRQENLVSQIQAANNQFVAAKSAGQAGMSREEKLKELAIAYDSFVELKNNLEEGTKFYNDLTQLLVKFQSKVNDLCFARKTEKEELLRDLNNSIARQPSTSPPSAPAYQQPTEAPTSSETPAGETPAAKQPPPRPPPPTRPAPPVPSAAPPPQAPPPAAAAAPPPQNPYGMGYPAAQPAYPQQVAGAPAYPPAYGPTTTPYPVYPPGGYAPPPMPQGYNPYAQYAYPPQQPQYPQPGYPGYPGYPQQPQWPR